MEDLLKSLAPFSTPLNLVLLAGLAWLARDRAQIIASLDLAHQALVIEKDKRSEMLEKLYGEFMERGEAMAKVMADFATQAAALLRSKQ
jgi:predicted nucleotidyltransferase